VNNIVLTGFMGTGKTAVGRELAKLLDMKLVDVDAEVEKSEKMKISRIFETSGEGHFRDLETAAIKRLAAGRNLVISTGGGAVLREENMEVLRKTGIVFCLSASPETILSRTSGSKDRPLLNVKDPLQRIGQLLESRRLCYQRAGAVINTEGKTPLQIAEEIAGIFRCRK
jgi:shikimate kinase